MVESIFITGLGGQGILTLAGLIADLAAAGGCRVSLFRAKGMAQRGGRVTAEIRYSADGGAVFGPRIGAGQADVLIGLELGETVASLDYLRSDGLLLAADVALIPAAVALKKQDYPGRGELERLSAPRSGRIVCVPPPARALNMFMLGLWLRAGGRFDVESAEALIAARLREGREAGLASFRRGWEYDGAGA